MIEIRYVKTDGEQSQVVTERFAGLIHGNEWVNKSSVQPTQIILLKASGEELSYIMRCFTNIPINAIKNSNTWRGSLAQFIYENL